VTLYNGTVINFGEGGKDPYNIDFQDPYDSEV